MAGPGACGGQLSTFGPECPFWLTTRFGGGGAGSRVFTANRIHYLPILVPEVCAVTKMAYCVGSVANGTVDIGIYDSVAGKPKNRLGNMGATAQGTINALQIWTPGSPIALPPGLCFFALVGSSATGTSVSGNQDNLQYTGVGGGHESGASATLPAVVGTFVDNGSGIVHHLIWAVIEPSGIV
jgi:triacylglycerol esterase/lipase EstA (alpha/beta hydrolase family)